MGFRKNKNAAPTFEERSNAAAAKAGAALSVFDGVVDDLEAASAEQIALMVDLDNEAERLRDEADQREAEADAAYVNAEANSAAADKIRSLFAA